MQRVIDIPEILYTKIQNGKADKRTLETVILYGTPLPKRHGRLIDADAFISKIEDVSKRHKYENLRVDGILTVDDVLKAVIESLQNEGLAEGDAPTIIEADDREIAHNNECRTCSNCKRMKGSLPYIIWTKGSPFIYCRKYKEHFSPNDNCKLWVKVESEDK